MDGMNIMAQTLENAGVVSVLLPYGSASPEYTPWIPSMCANTRKIKFMLAIRPYAITPEFAAKLFKTYYFTQLFRDRVTLNIVAGILNGDEKEYTFKHYPYDVSYIEDIDKRIDLARRWAESFRNIINDNPEHVWKAPDIYTIADSPITVDLANDFCDFAICNLHRAEYNREHLKKDVKSVIVIDPLIVEEGEKIEYLWHPTWFDENKVEDRKQRHEINGTYEEVKQQIINLALEHNTNEFLIHTDQKDISKLLKLVKELTELEPKELA
jgi:alkanesulfonate monooxygenase SsuD/methylene tetrahydromethanopterin reductase-like flavin-dependent oxidoreductase (luciferase family)